MAKFSLLPGQGRFFVLFEESDRNAAEMAQQLKQMLYNCDNVRENVEKIIEMEHTGDKVAHEIIALVHRTFITTFDREDIALLAHSLDDSAQNPSTGTSLVIFCPMVLTMPQPSLRVPKAIAVCC